MQKKLIGQLGLLDHLHQYGIDVEGREIYLHSYLDAMEEEEPGVEYRMATTAIKNLNLLDRLSDKPIKINMHCCGGYDSDGFALVDCLQNLRSHVTIIAYAQASSMSSIILQAGDLRLMMPNTYFMAHFGDLSIDDNAISAQSAAEWNKKMCEKMLDIYSERCVEGSYFKDRAYSKSRVKSFLKRKMKDKSEWYLNSEEAMDFGFCDGIVGQTHNLKGEKI